MATSILRFWSAVGFALALAACGSEQQPLEITNAQALGSVGGVVLDASTRAPLAGVEVSLVAGGTVAVATTDTAGAFAFTEVPAGVVTVTLAHGDYLSVSLRGTLGGADEFPVDNSTLTFGPIGMIPASGTFSALLVYDDGSAASNLTVTARTGRRFYDYSATTDYGTDAQWTVVTATSDATGLVTLTGLPDYILLGDAMEDLVMVVVPPVPSTDPTVSLYRYPGGSFVYHMTAVGATTPVINLTTTSPGPLAVVSSNIEALEGSAATSLPSIVPGAGPVWVTFNQPLSPTATLVSLVDENGHDLTPQVNGTVTYNTLQLAFAPELEAGSEYNLVLYAVSGLPQGLSRADLWAPFFTSPADTLVKPASVREVIDENAHTEVLHLTFGEPIGTGDPATNVFGGANCLIFFTIPLDADDTTVGDDPGELGHPSCRGDIVFEADEPDPAGLAGQSGYTKYWRVNLPVLPGPNSVPVGTPMSIVFSRIANANHLVRRVTGAPVTDFLAPGDPIVLP